MSLSTNSETLIILYNNNSLFLLYSLGIIYGVFSFSNLLAPTFVAVIGPKITMFLSGLLYRWTFSCYALDVDKDDEADTCLLTYLLFSVGTLLCSSPPQHGPFIWPQCSLALQQPVSTSTTNDHYLVDMNLFFQNIYLLYNADYI